jgi:hypothetical protein
MAIVARCKEWTRILAIILDSRSKQQTSRMISTLLFIGQGV